MRRHYAMKSAPMTSLCDDVTRWRHYAMTSAPMRDRKRGTVTATKPEALRTAAVSGEATRRKPEVTWFTGAQCRSGVSFCRDSNPRQISPEHVALSRQISCFIGFYPRDAMLASVLAIALCLSVCPSEVGVLSNRLEESNWFFSTRTFPPILLCVKRKFWYLQK